MIRGLTIGLAVAALGIMVSFVAADSSPRDPVTSADAVPAYQILTTLREMGFDPKREPVRRGPYYVLHAFDPRGVEMRVIADAQFGDIVSIAPARPDYAVRYYRGPRIIQVPQPGDREDYDDRGDRTSRYDDRDNAAPTGDDDHVEEAAPPPRAKPRPQRHSDLPREPRRKPYNAPSPAERRTVLSAPPPPPEGPSPIYPTPKFGDKAEAGEKFGAPTVTGAPPPPPGYRPPATPPQQD